MVGVLGLRFLIDKNRCQEGDVEIGHVYNAKGGAGSTRFWLIVAMNKSMTHALGLDIDGNIVSTTSYSIRTFEDRKLVGKANIHELELSVEWIE